jgi:hypothetical protein
MTSRRSSGRPCDRPAAPPTGAASFKLLDTDQRRNDNGRSPERVNQTVSCWEGVAVLGSLSQVANDPIPGRFRAGRAVAFDVPASMSAGIAARRALNDCFPTNSTDARRASGDPGNGI